MKLLRADALGLTQFATFLSHLGHPSTGGAYFKRIDRLYRNRGGIESSYKLANRRRPRTSSQNPAIRLFNYAVALFLQNAWVTTRWIVALPRRGRAGRVAPNGFFPFTQYLELVLIRLREVLGERRRVTRLGA